eukprot:CAMPEP_0198303726 /NCGR_PEP_ID=MMETSP1449-20131203/57039_1 /TAXON_ID=420275 /ORGANISM="Attheya septentrionalis, Strain CCMP2084" /LENGTH=460 /DNA_ID=CAMNT_0044006233 /DNA_START=938 /DNA_END=2320 /DNA_ORIENTATION=-
MISRAVILLAAAVVCQASSTKEISDARSSLLSHFSSSSVIPQEDGVRFRIGLGGETRASHYNMYTGTDEEDTYRALSTEIDSQENVPGWNACEAERKGSVTDNEITITMSASSFQKRRAFFPEQFVSNAIESFQDRLKNNGLFAPPDYTTGRIRFSHWKNRLLHPCASPEEVEEMDYGTDDSSGLTAHDKAELAALTRTLMKNVIGALDDESIWTKINEKDDIFVWKTDVDIKHQALSSNDSPPTPNGIVGGGTHNTKRRPKKKKQTVEDGATIRTEAILDAPPKAVYDLFMDESRAHEYNDNCKDLEDIALIDSHTKISWCSTGKFGPFKARDFVTLVHFQELHPHDRYDGYHDNHAGYVSIAAHVDHCDVLCPAQSKGKNFVRSKIQMAATFMKPVHGEPNRTRFIQLTQIGELGGVADSAVAKRITKGLSENASVDFVKKFNAVLVKTMADEKRKQK